MGNQKATCIMEAILHQKDDKLSIFVKITKMGLAITLAGLLFLEALIASDWRLLQASSCGTLSMIPAASVEAFA